MVNYQDLSLIPTKKGPPKERERERDGHSSINTNQRPTSTSKQDDLLIAARPVHRLSTMTRLFLAKASGLEVDCIPPLTLPNFMNSHLSATSERMQNPMSTFDMIASLLHFNASPFLTPWNDGWHPGLFPGPHYVFIPGHWIETAICPPE